jgi:polar amino acid transport system substrate-binding protein
LEQISKQPGTGKPSVTLKLAMRARGHDGSPCKSATSGASHVLQAAVVTSRLLFCLALLLWISAAPSHAQADAAANTTKVVVGTMRVPPFVLRTDDGQWSGLSIDLWKEIAADLKMSFEFREYDYDLAGLLDDVERRQIDAAVAAIPVTLEGEARFDFSHPYFAAGLGIAVHTEPQGGVLATLASFFTYQVIASIAVLVAGLVCVGMLVWLAERRQKSQFDPRPLHGIADGVWWAAVTMTTTGYGDKVPVTFRGRAVAMVWMFASIFCVTLFSATLASSFVVGRLKSAVSAPGDLARARVAVVSATTGEQWLNTQGLAGRSYPFVIQAIKALQRSDVQALVYERAILGHLIKQYGWRDLQVLPHTLAVRDYAIALPTDSPIKEPINRALLKIIHRADWKDLVQRYVGGTDQVVATDKP